MANCRRRKANVGCGCNLKEGLCSYCVAQDKKHLIVNPKTSDDDVVSKID